MSSEIYVSGPNFATISGAIFLSYTEIDLGLFAGYYNALHRGNTSLGVRPNDDRVTSVFLLTDDGGDDGEEGIRNKFNDLVNILEGGRVFHSDPFTSFPAYLYHKTEGSMTLRSIIYDYAIDVLTDGLANPLLIHNQARIQVAITHANYWEPEDPQVCETGDVSGSGDTWDIREFPGIDLQANLDSRIGSFVFQHQSGQLARAYAGIKPDRDVAGTFDPWIDSGDFTIPGSRDASSETPSTGASGNESIVVTFDTIQTMIGRCYILSTDFTATPQAYVGSYLVLLRYKLSAAGEVGVRLHARYGTSDSTSSILTPIQYLTSTGYTFAELGEITLPPHPYRRYSRGFDIANFGLSIEAELITGASTNLHIDGLLLLPSEHYIRADVGNPASVAVTDRLHVVTDEDGTVSGFVGEDVEPATILQQATVTAKNWAWPYRGGVIVIMTMEGAGYIHSLNRLVNLDIEVYERFRLYEAHQ